MQEIHLVEGHPACRAIDHDLIASIRHLARKMRWHATEVESIAQGIICAPAPCAVNLHGRVRSEHPVRPGLGLLDRAVADSRVGRVRPVKNAPKVLVAKGPLNIDWV